MFSENADTNMATATQPTPKARPRLSTGFRAVLLKAFPLALIALMLGGLFDVNPPLPIHLILLFTCCVFVFFVAMQRVAWAFILAFIIVSIGFVVTDWLLTSAIEIRAVTDDDQVYDRYFGIQLENCTRRNIAVVTGTFTLGTWVSGALYHIDGGEITELNSITVGRSPRQIGAPHWKRMKITFALGEKDGIDGRMTQLGAEGYSRGGGSGYELSHNVNAATSKTLTGRLTRGTKYILYVEGDDDIKVFRRMPIEQFAEQNDGNYLVVEIMVH